MHACPHVETFLGVVITRSGIRQTCVYCLACQRKRGTVPSPSNVSELPVVRDNRTSDPCERCGSTEGVEEHHWAPRYLFEDADLWPTALLCKTCHTRWHHATGTASGRRVWA